ncbi:hypothetical protein PAPHI01_1495 [Pancytospora philotis]|nr:hypothetical protein PAPHI01_1495 [Pancytospora philotis]
MLGAHAAWAFALLGSACGTEPQTSVHQEPESATMVDGAGRPFDTRYDVPLEELLSVFKTAIESYVNAELLQWLESDASFVRSFNIFKSDLFSNWSQVKFRTLGLLAHPSLEQLPKPAAQPLTLARYCQSSPHMLLCLYRVFRLFAETSDAFEYSPMPHSMPGSFSYSHTRKNYVIVNELAYAITLIREWSYAEFVFMLAPYSPDDLVSFLLIKSEGVAAEIAEGFDRLLSLLVEVCYTKELYFAYVEPFIGIVFERGLRPHTRRFAALQKLLLLAAKLNARNEAWISEVLDTCGEAHPPTVATLMSLSNAGDDQWKDDAALLTSYLERLPKLLKRPDTACMFIIRHYIPDIPECSTLAPVIETFDLEYDKMLPPQLIFMMVFLYRAGKSPSRIKLFLESFLGKLDDTCVVLVLNVLTGLNPNFVGECMATLVELLSPHRFKRLIGFVAKQKISHDSLDACKFLRLFLEYGPAHLSAKQNDIIQMYVSLG